LEVAGLKKRTHGRMEGGHPNSIAGMQRPRILVIDELEELPIFLIE